MGSFTGSSNSQDKSIGGDVGSVAGGVIGSVLFPGVGTVVGSAAGDVLGSQIGGLFGPQSSNSGSGSVGSSLFGGGGSTNNSSEISGLNTIAQAQTNLSNTDQSLGASTYGQGQNIYDPAYQQYISGTTGQLTPSQQALVTQNLGTENTGTMSTYGNLGLGGSTMEGQDLASNVLKSTAETSNINFQNESLGLQGLQTADQYYGTANQSYGNAGTALSGASSSLYNAGQLTDANLTALNNAISSLGNKSSSSLTGTGLSGIGSAFSSLFGSGTSGAASSGAADLSGGALTTGLY